MKLTASIRNILPAWIQRQRMDREMDAELRTHLELRADDLERSGVPRAEAERLARIEFGGMEHYKEECHEATGSLFAERLLQDLRYSVRVLRKSPGFTVAAVLTLALGIGANTVVFGALNALILRPLDLPRAESLYSIHRVATNSATQSYPDYVDYRDRNRSFEDLAASNFSEAGLDTGDNVSRSWGIVATGNYFDVLGVHPYLGRFFTAADEHGANSAPYVVLSYSYWLKRFQGDRGVVGRKIQLNKAPFTVIGVAPPKFNGTLLFFTPDFFVPMVNHSELGSEDVLHKRGDVSGIFITFGHLKAGVTPAQAAADINSISRDLAKEYPKDHPQAEFALARPSLYGDHLGRPVRAFLTALMVMAGLILLAACANLGSLFAARAADRAREIALRLALGASRMRIVRQLLTEAILISLTGGGIGLWGSMLLMRWLNAWQPFPQFPINVPVTPDAKVYVIALLLALASGFLFGVVPVRQVLRTDPYEVVKSGSSARAGRKISLRDFLLVGQIAICAVLVTSSLVAVRGLMRSMHSNFGFEPQNTLVVNTNLQMAGYKGDAPAAMQKRALETVASIPGVTAAGLVDWAPLNGSANTTTVFHDETTELIPAHAAETSVFSQISSGYLSAAGTTLLSGRGLTEHDKKDAPRVALVNQQFALKMFGSVRGAIGRYYKIKDGSRLQVVGVVENGKYQSLTETQQPAMFLPLLQSPSSETWMMVRYGQADRKTGQNRDPLQLAGAIRGKIRELDSGLPCFIETWTQNLALALFPSRVATVALGILGGMGAMLSLTGIFGMAAYSVSKRLRELGIRIALGAQHKEVLRAALGKAFRLLAVGSVVGLILGILASRVLAFIVFEATPRDPLILAGVVLAMAFLGLVATWIPARRALSVNPLILLREE
jgi:predicted permease